MIPLSKIKFWKNVISPSMVLQEKFFSVMNTKQLSLKPIYNPMGTFSPPVTKTN